MGKIGRGMKEESPMGTDICVLIMIISLFFY